jgi:hypothetical protein
VSYHVRILRELDCIELVRTGQRRGAMEHHYRATATPRLDDAQWATLSAALPRTMLGRTVTEVLKEASAGGFDGLEAYAGHLALTLDEQGREELRALLAETVEAARRIDAESAARQADRDAPIATRLAILHYRDV